MIELENTSFTSDHTTIASECTLTLFYYPIRGVAQPIRILCHYLQIDFIDKFITKCQQNEIESGFRIGYPMVEDGDIRIHEQISIINYLCMRSERQNLMGLTPQHNAKINQFLFKYSVQKKKIMSIIMQGIKYLQDQTLTRSQICQKPLKKLIQQCKFVETCLKRTLKTKKYILEYLTVLDFVFYEICFYIDGFYRDVITKDSEYYSFIKYKNMFEKHSFYQKNKKNIESNPLFFEFSSAGLNSLVARSWKGNNQDKIFVKNYQK